MPASDQTPPVRLADALVDLARRRIPPIPSPMDPRVQSLHPHEDRWLVREASLAVHRLLRLGATTEDLYAVARHAYASAIMDSVGVLDGLDDTRGSWELVVEQDDGTHALLEGLHEDVWYAINSMRAEDLTG